MNRIQKRPVSDGGAGARGPMCRPRYEDSTVGASADEVRNSLWQVLCGHARPSRANSDQGDRARAHLAGNAAAANALVAERFLGDRFDAQLVSCTHLLRALELTSQGDPAGSLDVARRLARHLDQCLMVYDMVNDKTRLFEVLPPEQATTVTRLFRLRRGLAVLASRLAAEGAGRQGVQ